MADLLITGAEIVDGTGGPPMTGEVVIEGDRIVTVGKPTSTSGGSGGRRVINARGLIACPGFVDVHGHSDYHLLVNPRAESKVKQGVTTEIGGNCGYSPAPIGGEALDERREMCRRLYGLELDWERLDDYFHRVAQQGCAMNFATLVGHNTIRASVMGGADRPPTPDELNRMVELVRAGMREGALGLSTGLVYPPACFSGTEELITLARAAQEAGGLFATHMRSEGKAVVEAVEESLRVAREAGVSVQISHLKTAGQENWGKLERVLTLIEAARRDGLDVTCDRYPYTASYTTLTTVLPTWVLEGGRTAAVARLKDVQVKRKIREQYAKERRGADYWERIMIAQVTLEKHKSFEGLTISQAWRQAGRELYSFLFDLLIEEEGLVEAIFFSMSDENLREILRQPYVMLGTDAAAVAHDGPTHQGKPHPRTFGTYPKFLGQFVRDEGLLDLSTAVRKCTSDPCRKFGLTGRGLLTAGAYADLVLFDPDRVADRADYPDPWRDPEGIRYVIVNGEVTVEDGEHTGQLAGRILRRAAR